MGFVITEFATIPALPAQYRHQTNRVSIVRYLVPEGTDIEPGTPLVLIENWWARFELISEVRARVAKNLLDAVPEIISRKVLR